MNGFNIDNNDLNIFSLDLNIEVNSNLNSCCLFGNKSEPRVNHENIMKKSFAGHYVVLVGYDDYKKVVFYLNPSVSKPLSYTSYDSFERARKAFGTDEDILFIYT